MEDRKGAQIELKGGLSELPPYWLRRVGLLSIFLVALCISIFCILADGLDHPFGGGPTPEFTPNPLTGPIIALGSVLSSFWYVWFPGLAIFYGGWVVRRFKRILWFNAICAVTMPLIVLVPFLIYIQHLRRFPM